MLLKSENYIHIQAWMILGLQLYGTELLIYAILFGFCQNGTPKVIDLAYFAYWIRGVYGSPVAKPVSKRTIANALHRLEAKGLITIKRTSGKRNIYSVNEKKIREAVQKTVSMQNQEILKLIESKGKENYLNNVVNDIIKKESIRKEKNVTLQDIEEIEKEFNS